MQEGVEATNLRASTQVVGGYVEGLYAWSAANWARFPRSVKVRIAVFRDTNDGHVLDVEPGNATPAESVDWVLMRRAARGHPTPSTEAPNPPPPPPPPPPPRLPHPPSRL